MHVDISIEPLCGAIHRVDYFKRCLDSGIRGDLTTRLSKCSCRGVTSMPYPPHQVDLSLLTCATTRVPPRLVSHRLECCSTAS